MGATCGCADKEDTRQEISSDPKKLGENKHYEVYRDSHVKQGQIDKIHGATATGD
jgi:hypothetical protein